MKRIALATIGTQGDVQPFVALALRLKDAGHSVVLGTSENFQGFVESYGLDFVSLGKDMQAFLTQDAFRGRVVSARALGNATTLWRDAQGLIETATRAAWPMARGADALVLNMNTSFGLDFAEALGIPAVFIAPQPLTATSDFPLVIFGSQNLGRPLNRLSYGIMGLQQWFYNLPRNRLRAELMQLPARRNGAFFRATDGTPVPVLYCYSPLVSPAPADWPASSVVTGFFRLEDRSGWAPTPELRAFLDAGEPPVFIGFGSMPFGTERNTEILATAMALWGGRAVVARGWGGIDPKRLPGSVFPLLERAPHDKLFPLMRAVVHHGGAGTTAAGLTAGKPSLAVPQTVDQPFWASRIHALGCGPAPVPLRTMTPEKLAAALRDLSTNLGFAEKAATLGVALRAEDGTGNAVREIERIMARSPRTTTPVPITAP
jgi:sterol 3beta-glucosyltransferase